MEITMTAKEILRSQVMAQVIDGVLDQASAAARLQISIRQVKRLKLARTACDSAVGGDGAAGHAGSGLVARQTRCRGPYAPDARAACPAGS